MTRVGFSISATNVDEYRELVARLRKAGKSGKELRKNLRKQIAEAGKPVVDDVKQAVLSIPITSHGGGGAQRRRYNVERASTARAKRAAGRRNAGLRRTIASSVAVQQTGKGIKIVARSAKLPPDQRNLPRHLDSPKGWRHPVFGDTSRWVHQQGKPYFGATIRKHAPRFRRAVIKAMDETTSQIER